MLFPSYSSFSKCASLPAPSYVKRTSEVCDAYLFYLSHCLWKKKSSSMYTNFKKVSEIIHGLILQNPRLFLNLPLWKEPTLYTLCIFIFHVFLFYFPPVNTQTIKEWVSETIFQFLLQYPRLFLHIPLWEERALCKWCMFILSTRLSLNSPPVYTQTMIDCVSETIQ